MNHVFLSGIAEKGALLVSRENETPHAVMELTVIHRTAGGIEKREQYPISAWRGTAQRLVELAKPGARISIKGYLSQRQKPEGILLEVTAEEFLVAQNQAASCPPRCCSPWNPNLLKKIVPREGILEDAAEGPDPAAAQDEEKSEKSA